MAKVRKRRKAAARRRREQGRKQAGERLTPSATVPFGRTALIRGMLTSAAGKPIANRSIEVRARLKHTGARYEHVGTVGTDRAGRFSYVAPKGASRTLRFIFDGTAVLRPAEGEVRLAVPGSSTLRVSRRRVRNGRSVRFSGTVAPPVIGGLKLLDLQAFYRGKWRTFATPRASAKGVWRFRYRFEATTGKVVYRFRVRIRREAAYPYELGYSRTAKVIVTGR
jgi:hypothetical protein